MFFLPKLLLCIVVFAAYAILVALFAFIMKRKGASASKITYVVLFLAALFASWLLKLHSEPAASSQLIPFYKVAAISDYGYKPILNDLVSYAAPFLIAGFLFIPAFPQLGVVASFIVGIVASLVCNIYGIATSGIFVTDEYILAGLGAAVGTGLYSIVIYALKKTSLPQKLCLPIPDKKRRTASWIACASVYFFIAFVLILDYGKTYTDLELFRSDVPLPDDITVSAELSKKSERVAIYSPSDDDAGINLAAMLRDTLMSDGFISYNADDIYTIESDTANIVCSPDGSWQYSFYGAYDGADANITKESADKIVRDFFAEKALITAQLYELTDFIELKDASGAITGYDLYYTTSYDGCPIINSSRVVVGLSSGGTITKIRKDGSNAYPAVYKRIISQSSAYSKLINGEGSYTLFTDIKQAVMYGCKLAYMVNGQGDYLPVWVFEFIGTGEDGNSVEFEGYMPAMK